MTDLNEIGFEITENDGQSVETLEDCPSPPPPFHRAKMPLVQPPMIFNDHNSTITVQNIVPFDNIFFTDAKTYLFETTNASSIVNESTTQKSTPSFFQRFLSFFRPSTNRPFDQQCEQLLNLTKHPCLMSDRIHLRILYTIYRRLTNSREIFYQTFGPHWEQIGFQSSNPETDFRSTGLFSIFYLLYFVDSMYLPLARQIYEFSHDEHQQFPFACVGINLANVLIKHLRQHSSREKLRKLTGETLAINLGGKLFIALYLNFYLIWKEHAYTIVNSQQVLTELEQILTRRSNVLFERFDQYFRRKTNGDNQTF